MWMHLRHTILIEWRIIMINKFNTKQRTKEVSTCPSWFVAVPESKVETTGCTWSCRTEELGDGAVPVMATART